jgi:hypothetical protein
VRNPAAPLSAGQGPANTVLGPKVREIVIRYE